MKEETLTRRKEVFEHLKARLLDPEDRGVPLYTAVAYVQAGILTNGDYAKLQKVRTAPTPPPAPPRKRRTKTFGVRFHVIEDGRRGRIRGGKKRADTIEWLDPEPDPEWTRRYVARKMAQLGAIRL